MMRRNLVIASFILGLLLFRIFREMFGFSLFFILMFSFLPKKQISILEEIFGYIIILFSLSPLLFFFSLSYSIFGKNIFFVATSVLGKPLSLFLFMASFIFTIFLLSRDYHQYYKIFREAVMLFWKKFKPPKNKIYDDFVRYKFLEFVPDAIYLSPISSPHKEKKARHYEESDSTFIVQKDFIEKDIPNAILVEEDNVAKTSLAFSENVIGEDGKETEKVSEENRDEEVEIPDEKAMVVAATNYMESASYENYDNNESSYDNVREEKDGDFVNILPPYLFLKRGNKTTFSDDVNFSDEIKVKSELLLSTLSNFGIEAEFIGYSRGPVVTLYELKPHPGIKISQVVSLADDLALALGVHRIRVIAPIPGKTAIGIEVPNEQREIVYLREVLTDKRYLSFDARLKIPLGKDISGRIVVEDLAKMPHLLIAGATGSGKSVCVNSIITGLIYNYYPDEVKFILIDPKIVELSVYEGIPHLLTPVLTEPNEAKKALQWAIKEMEERYFLLASLNSRDIVSYNYKIRERKDDKYRRLPYIVIVIDEFADLMLVGKKDIERDITRLAQKARAVGIHLIIATQRPSVDVITGIIKANFPARIAFQVASKIDSRTIIDQIGAERLLGMGDMLYLSPTAYGIKRIQGAFVSEKEISNVVSFIKRFNKPRYVDMSIDEDTNNGEKFLDCDPMFSKALEIVKETKKASASFLQRKLKIGYPRAARIIEEMEELGYVGPQNGSKPREVYI
jgi:DNA segregation ATPase FtsK/SpoIIIE-like protein